MNFARGVTDYPIGMTTVARIRALSPTSVMNRRHGVVNLTKSVPALLFSPRLDGGCVGRRCN
jgi:hypothetical protein